MTGVLPEFSGMGDTTTLDTLANTGLAGLSGGVAQVSAPSLLQTVSALGQGTPIGGGQGVGGMNFGQLGAGITDFFQAVGAGYEAKNYGLAAGLAEQEKEFTKENTAVQNAQASREVMMTIGKQKSEVAASGFTGGGSNMSLLRASAQQAALGHQMITLQGGINEAAYQEQATAYENMKHAETAAQNGDIAGGIINTVLGFIGL